MINTTKDRIEAIQEATMQRAMSVDPSVPTLNDAMPLAIPQRRRVPRIRGMPRGMQVPDFDDLL